MIWGLLALTLILLLRVLSWGPRVVGCNARATCGINSARFNTADFRGPRWHVERASGVINIALEGMMLIGAFAAAVGTLFTIRPGWAWFAA